MSKLAEEFLKIQTYEEYNRRRAEFKGLSIMEPEVREHLGKICPHAPDNVVKDGIIVEIRPQDRNW